MRRYITLAVSLLFVYTATAWNKFGQQSIATLAEQNLTESAKAQTTQILGGSLSSAAWWLQSVAKEPEYQHTNSWQFIHLTKELKSTTTSTEDGVVQIERCVDILKHRTQHSDSTVVVTLKTLIHLVADMHNLTHICIEGVEYSNKNFNFRVSNGFTGPKEVITKLTWRKFWESNIVNRHATLSCELLAEDLMVCYGPEKENFSKGDVRHWAADMGSLSAPLYKWAVPDYYMTREQHNRLVQLNNKCMARAGFRLAALLNDIFR